MFFWVAVNFLNGFFISIFFSKQKFFSIFFNCGKSLNGSIAFSSIDFISSISRLISKFSKYPKPSHSLQAPYGLLNENNLGDISG